MLPRRESHEYIPPTLRIYRELTRNRDGKGLNKQAVIAVASHGASPLIGRHQINGDKRWGRISTRDWPVPIFVAWGVVGPRGPSARLSAPDKLSPISAQTHAPHVTLLVFSYLVTPNYLSTGFTAQPVLPAQSSATQVKSLSPWTY